MVLPELPAGTLTVIPKMELTMGSFGSILSQKVPEKKFQKRLV
jgi:hypothetical protein